MNLILLLDDDFVDEGRRVVLRGRRLHHVLDVHRADVGKELLVGRLGGRMGHGMITSLSDDSLEMEVALFHDPPEPLAVTLVLAAPRPKVLSRVVSSVASMGVKRIFLVNAWKVEKSYWESPRFNEDHLWAQLILGLEQGRDTTLPVIESRRFLKPFVEEELPRIIEGTTPLIAHPSAGEEFPRGKTGPITLAIGPEGGFIEDEISMFRRAGFRPVRLGERTLRVESAIPALLGRLL